MIHEMGSVHHLLYCLLLLSFSTFFFSNHHLMAGACVLRGNGHEGDRHGFIGTCGDGPESKVEKVSGEDENREMRILLDRFRVLLGLKSYSIRRTIDPHNEHLLSPAPAPVEALAPAPVPLISKHAHHRAPAPNLKLILPPPPRYDSKEQGRSQSKSRVMRTVIAVAVSVGSTFTVVGLAMVLLCWRRGKNRSETSRRSKLFSCIWHGTGKNKGANPSNSNGKVSFDPGPELFYLNALRTFPEEISRSKQTCEMANVASKDSPSNTPAHETGESCGDPTNCDSDHAISDSVEEIHRLEPQLSDNESFHSLCDSHSSSARFSNASEANLSNPSIPSSPSHVSRRSASREDNSIEPTIPMKSPTRPSTLHSSSPQLHIQSASSPSHSSGQTSKMSSCPPSQAKPLCDAESNSSESVPTTAIDLSSPVASNQQPSPTHSLSGFPPQMSLDIQDSPTIVQNDSHSSANDSNSNPNHPSSKFSPNASSSMPLQNPSQALVIQSTSSGSTPPCPPLRLPLQKGHNSVPPPPPPPPPPVLRPPFPKGRNSIQRPPPLRPTPYQGEQSVEVGKDGSPLPKLRPLHWDKVRATPDRSMVWDKLRSSSFELDEVMIKSLFGYNLQNSMKNDEAKSKSPSPINHVLEPKRLQNITILSKALNATSEQVCNALLQGDGLSAQQLEALVKMVPTKEEEEKLSSYQGIVDELGSAEKFVKAILKIPFAFQRIEAMLYRDTFEDEVVHLRKSFAMLEEACNELRSSRLFLKLLEAVLKTGNRMNVGTIRGGARAFKLDALLKLADVKGTDGRTTLLHFVVQEMIRSEGLGLSENMKSENQKNKNKTAEDLEEDYKVMGLDLVSGLGTELENVKKTATVDLDVLASSVSNLSDGMAKLQCLVLKDLSVDNQNRIFANSMKSFIHHAGKDIKELKEDENRVFLQVREITEYFHGDVSKDEANPLRIFVIVRDFLGMLDRVCKEVRSLRIQSSPNAAVPFRAR